MGKYLYKPEAGRKFLKRNMLTIKKKSINDIKTKNFCSLKIN